MEKGKRLYESFKNRMLDVLKASGSTKRLDGGKYAVCHVLLSMDRRSDRTFLCGSVECKEWLASCGIYYHELFYAAILTVLPIFVTGGIHMDGFLDTCDALSSWQERSGGWKF